jgi:hypothetical protein
LAGSLADYRGLKMQGALPMEAPLVFAAKRKCSRLQARYPSELHPAGTGDAVIRGAARVGNPCLLLPLGKNCLGRDRSRCGDLRLRLSFVGQSFFGILLLIVMRASAVSSL